MRITFTAVAEEAGEEVLNAIERKIRLVLTRYSPRVRQLVVTLNSETNYSESRKAECCITVHFSDGSEAKATGKAREMIEAGVQAAHRAGCVIRRSLAYPNRAC